MNHLHCKAQLRLRWNFFFFFFVIRGNSFLTNQKMCSFYQHLMNPQNTQHTLIQRLNPQMMSVFIFTNIFGMKTFADYVNVTTVRICENITDRPTLSL